MEDSEVTDLHSSIFLLSNICNLVSLCLDSFNFVLWKFQLRSILKAHKLFGYVDGSTPKPSQFLAGNSSSTTLDFGSSSFTPQAVSNPLYDDWTAKDHALMMLISATLSPAPWHTSWVVNLHKKIWQHLNAITLRVQKLMWLVLSLNYIMF